MTIKNRIFILGLIIMQLTGNSIMAQSKDIMEQYELKATFLIRFLDYVSWENRAKNQTLKIAILEKCPITNSLLEIAKNKKIEVKEYENLDDLSYDNIIFVPYNCTVPIEKIVSKFSGKPVLIVTEHEGFGKKGAHMNFIMLDDKLKFEVNLKAIKKSGIGISSFLLQHAIIVQ